MCELSDARYQFSMMPVHYTPVSTEHVAWVRAQLLDALRAHYPLDFIAIQSMPGSPDFQIAGKQQCLRKCAAAGPDPFTVEEAQQDLVQFLHLVSPDAWGVLTTATTAGQRRSASRQYWYLAFAVSPHDRGQHQLYMGSPGVMILWTLLHSVTVKDSPPPLVLIDHLNNRFADVNGTSLSIIPDDVFWVMKGLDLQTDACMTRFLDDRGALNPRDTVLGGGRMSGLGDEGLQAVHRALWTTLMPRDDHAIWASRFQASAVHHIRTSQAIFRQTPNASAWMGQPLFQAFDEIHSLDQLLQWLEVSVPTAFQAAKCVDQRQGLEALQIILSSVFFDFLFEPSSQ